MAGCAQGETAAKRDLMATGHRRRLLVRHHDRKRRESETVKTLLMIDYYFPPQAGPGVLRTLGYVKHLSEFGWSPIVLTVQSGDNQFHDPSFLQRIPETATVERTGSLEFVRVAKRLFAKGFANTDECSENGTGTGRPWAGPRWLRTLGHYVMFPDRRIGWFPFAIARALSIMRTHNVDAIYSTSTAVTSHLIAYLLKRRFAKPWIADFQDPWAERLDPIHKNLARRIEHLIVRNADLVTFTADPTRELFARTHPGIPSQKLVTIPLGFDPDVFRDVDRLRQAKFTIAHFGGLYHGRSPGPFLEALALCMKDHPSLARDVQVRFFGSFDAELLPMTEALLDRRNLKNIVRFEGIVPYRVIVQQMLSADVLLLVAFEGEDGRDLIPSKLFEYLASGNPILSLGPREGPASRTILAASAGLVIDPRDISAIKDAIASLYQSWQCGRPAFSADADVVRSFTWTAVTEQFAEALDEMLPPRSGRSNP